MPDTTVEEAGRGGAPACALDPFGDDFLLLGQIESH